MSEPRPQAAVTSLDPIDSPRLSHRSLLGVGVIAGGSTAFLCRVGTVTG